jgi:GntR family transcriptional regulator/MocR family aminotransferase
MPETQAIAGLDLLVELSGTRPSRDLERALRDATVDGRLAPGTRLPASRTLARDLGVARSTVEQAYAQLAAEGWLVSRVGAGTWVADGPGARTTGAQERAPAPALLDLRAGVPDASGFPRAAWARAARRAVAGAPADLLGYGDPRGAGPLREALATYLARARGVRADPGRVLVAGGFTELLSLTCHALRARGARRLAVEGYGHALHREVARAAGLDVVPVPVDAGGIDVGALAAAAVDAVLVTPAHQFPTGVPLAADRRLALVRWARDSGALVVEDDYDGELRLDRRAIGALQALAPEHVLYAGTASKAVAPAVGLAWGVAAEPLLDELLDQRRVRGRAPSAVTGLTLAELITGHDYDRGVRRLRDELRRRRVALERLVAEEIPGGRLSGLPAGLHAVLELPDGTGEQAVQHEARARGLAVEGLGGFAAAGLVAGRAPAVVVGFGAPPPHRYREALELLATAVRAARGTQI